MIMVDMVSPRIYNGGMRKIAEEELEDRRYPTLDHCPNCNGLLKVAVLVGPGVVRPQMKYCDTCSFTKDISRARPVPAR